MERSINGLLDAIELHPSQLAIGEDDGDHSVGEVDEEDDNGQHDEVDVEDLDVVFRGGDAVPAGAACLQRPEQSVDVDETWSESLHQVYVPQS